MSSADDKQRRHNVPSALVQRLNTLIEGSEDWHEWHQAGVLMFQLTMSYHMRFGKFVKIIDSLSFVEWLYDNALTRMPQNNPLARYAVLCDKELATAYGRYAQRRNANLSRFSMFQKIINGLMQLPESPAQQHQLGIAYSFMARAAWWMHLSDPAHGLMPERACEWEAFAEQHFRASGRSLDRHQALRSHMLAMALIHAELGTANWEKTYALPALRSAVLCCDLKHAVRAWTISQYGIEGEYRLRMRRDTPEAFNEATRLMLKLWPDTTETQ